MVINVGFTFIGERDRETYRTGCRAHVNDDIVKNQFDFNP
jgi:hypothetical protein